MHRLGSWFVGCWEFSVRARDKGFSLLASGAFASFGRRSVIELPIRLGRPHKIAVGEDVSIGPASWLHVAPESRSAIAIEIGDGTSIAGSCVLSAYRSIKIGRKVLFARNVYIADHMHAFRDLTQAVLDQGVDRESPIEVCDGAWLGQNVVVGPGVRIGRGAVIGANAVVLSDVPDHSVAVGAPARVVRSFAPAEAGTGRGL